MKSTYIIFIALLLVFSACSRVDDACIEMPSKVIIGDEVQLICCSDNDDYVIWEFEESDAKLGERVFHRFRKLGGETIKQTVYSDDGRNNSSESRFVTVGTMRIDSVVVTFINTFGQVFENSLPDVYIVVNGNKSNELYMDTPDSEVPRTFTFPANVFGRFAEISFFDFNASSEDQFLGKFIARPDRKTFESPIIIDGPVDRFHMKVYWQFVTE